MIPALLPKQLTTCPDFLNFSTCSLVKLVPSSTDPPELVIMLIKYRKYLFVSILTWEMLGLCFVHPIFCFWFLVTFGNEVTKIRKYYVIFVYILQGKMGKTEKKERKSRN